MEEGKWQLIKMYSIEIQAHAIPRLYLLAIEFILFYFLWLTNVQFVMKTLPVEKPFVSFHSISF